MKNKIRYTIVLAVVISCTACSSPTREPRDLSLQSELVDIINSAPGTVGVAVVSTGDTVLINNGVRFPMMSVFKLHQAIATADKLQSHNSTLDSTITIQAGDLERDTWSPVLNQYSTDSFDITISELLKAAIIQSDNNASNILFNRIVSVSEVDSIVKFHASDTTFNIAYTEAEMKQNHELSYYNYTSPLAAALLIKDVFEREIFSSAAQDSIRAFLSATTTGGNRLGAPIANEEGVLFAHKTGSGYRNSHGVLVAHHDVGYFQLPDNKQYSLAVLIKDFDGNETEASGIIADVSRCVYQYFNNK